jgi:ABC-type molybdate transport system substrate-binding protein
VRLFSTLAVQGALRGGILDAWAARSGSPVQPSFDPTSVLLRRIAAGERPDVLVAVAEELRRPELAGVIDAALAVPLVRTGVGLAVAKDAPRPPIGTVRQLVTALRAARSVAYSRTGASGIYFARLLGSLGIADEVNARATVVAKGFTANALLDGRADLAVQQVSELRTISGVDLVGPLPEPVQRYTEFAAAPAPGVAAALELARFLRSDEAHEHYAAYGLQRLPAA